MKVGLLGGTFNPAHEGHLYISREAMKRLGLSQVWWLVTPGNPLKPEKDKENFAARLASARKMAARNPNIKVSAIEKKLGTVYTIDTIRRLKSLYPSHQFIWLMGDDNLASFHKWKNWREIFKQVPIAVFARGDAYKALASRAIRLFINKKLILSKYNKQRLPAWQFFRLRKHEDSSTALRKEYARKH